MRQPVVFAGHGSPMNAVEDNRYSQAWQRLGQELPRPRAILAISAHWFVPGTFVTAEPRPKTIHDFGGFPEALYEIQYGAPGAPELATRLAKLLPAGPRTDWGLDHGTWSVLCHMFPKADVPVLQLSIDQRLQPAEHLELGKQLQALRDDGVLILGSGNVTHNLRHAMNSMRTGEPTPAWATRFDAEVKQAFEQHDGAALGRFITGDDGRLAHPSPDHFLPLLYVLGAAGGAGAVRYPVEGFDLSSVSMRSIVIG